jgi:hypothetical protein
MAHKTIVNATFQLWNTHLMVRASIMYRQPPDKLDLIAYTTTYLFTSTTAISKPVWQEVDGIVKYE